MSFKELLIHLVQVLAGVLLMRASLRKSPILEKYTRLPLPDRDQKFTRVTFFIAGLVLILGAMWSFWLVWHISNWLPLRSGGPRELLYVAR